MSSAGCGLIQTSTDRAHGPAVLLGERFESGIIRNLRFYFHGSRERIALHGLRRQRLTMLPLYLIRRISRVIYPYLTGWMNRYHDKIQAQEIQLQSDHGQINPTCALVLPSSHSFSSVEFLISGDRLWSSWSAGLAMTRLLTGWRPYIALLGLLETTKFTKDNLNNLIRANTFDDSVMTAAHR